MKKIDKKIAEYEEKVKKNIVTRPREYSLEGFTTKQWREHLCWLQGVVFGLKTAKNI